MLGQLISGMPAHLGGKMELRMSSVWVRPGFCSTGGRAPCNPGSTAVLFSPLGFSGHVQHA